MHRDVKYDITADLTASAIDRNEKIVVSVLNTRLKIVNITSYEHRIYNTKQLPEIKY